MKTALLQITASDDPAENLEMVRAMMAHAAAQGAQFILTPEVTNCVSTSTTRQHEVLQHEEDDITLAGLCEQAAKGDAKARQLAWELDKALHVLSTFDESPDLVLYYKHLMVLEGDAEYARHFNGSDSLSPSQKAFAEQQLDLFKSWYANWPGAQTIEDHAHYRLAHGR